MARKAHFEAMTAEPAAPRSGIWEVPDHILDEIGGGLDWTQSQPGGGFIFAQNFACFAQNIGNFSQGTPPTIHQPPPPVTGD